MNREETDKLEEDRIENKKNMLQAMKEARRKDFCLTEREAELAGILLACLLKSKFPDDDSKRKKEGK